MKPKPPSPPRDAPTSSVRADASELTKVSSADDVAAGSLAAGLSSDAAAQGMRCMIPGCLEPHPWAAAPATSAQGNSIALGGAAALQAVRADLRDHGLRRAALNTAWQLLWVAWRFLRQASGDDAYERYLDHMVRAHPGEHAMRRGEYYRFRTEQKWNRITRCC